MARTCHWDEELQLVVHGFAGACRTCGCGAVKVDEPRRRFGQPFIGRKKGRPEGYEFRNLDIDSDDFDGHGELPESSDEGGVL